LDIYFSQPSKIHPLLYRARNGSIFKAVGVSRKDFNQVLNQLSKQFGENAGANNTIWRILNNLVIKFGSENAFLKQIYREMASLVSVEGRDPTPFLLEAEKAR